MKVDISKENKNTVILKIEIPTEVAAQEYNKACKKIGDNVVVPGFRKGKAPRNMIESYVGTDKIKKEALNRLLPKVVADVVSEHQLELAVEPIVDSFTFDLGQPLQLSVKLETKPEVKLNKYKGGKYDVAKFEQPKDAMEKELKALTEKFATLEPIINRPTKNDDIVNLDYNGTIDGEPIKGGAAKGHQLDLGNSNFIKGFAEQLVGKSIGEDFKISVKFPEDYHDKNLAAKDAEFQIKINEIKEKIIPELNDELAQKVGPFQTIEELKTDLTEYLKKSEEIENTSRAEKVILSKVIEQAEIELPDSMINKEARVLMEELQTKVKNQGVSWDQFLDAHGHENIWNSSREEASKRVKSSLVMSEIAKVENVTITDEDYVNRVKELANLYNTNEKVVFDQLSQNANLAQALAQQIMTQKIIKFLYDNNEVKYVAEASEAKPVEA